MNAATGAATGRDGRVRVRLLAVIVAVAAALAVWAVAVLGLGVDLEVTPGSGSPQPVGPGSVVVASLVAGGAGWGLLALLERFLSRSRTVWTVVAVVVLVASLGGPLAATTAAAAATLGAMHLAVGASLIPLLRRTA